MASSVFQGIADEFVVKFGADLFKDIGNFISHISPLFAAGFGIYICIIALDAYNRGLDESAVDLSKRMFGWMVIIAAAFNASQYGVIAEWVYGLPDATAAAFGGNLEAGLFDKATDKIEAISVQFELLREPFDDLDELGYVLMLFGVEYAIKILAYLLLGVIFAYYVVGKILLSLNLMVGPLFVGAMLFPATRQYGMNWIGQCLNSIITIALLAVLSGLQMEYFSGKIDEYATLLTNDMGTSLGAAGAVGTAAALIPIFMTMTIAFVLAVWKLPAMVSALTGGASMEGFGGNLGRMAGNTRTAQAINRLPANIGKAFTQAFTKIFGNSNKGGGISPK
ncbi:type IV secretion system protein [Neisseria iguanae]|uniref:Conjugal transfer protein TrbL n=1 Tax=Neisseria iguanae TaxID=90242 RepID=A0A2P7U2P0_9NEIS|nr:type IV secretion system protein [Neisseria iguanae]PSJ81215.1 hypothetical protein C7N83_01975 [Neisseria iguanae]